MVIIPENAASGRMRRKTLIKMRMLAILGQLAALFAARFGFGLPIDLTLPLAVIAASLLFNIVAIQRAGGKPYLHNKGATFALGFDIVQLAALLFVTGGFTNPFIILMLAPITIAATILSGRSIIALLTLTLVCYGVMFFAQSLPWPEPHHVSTLYTSGAVAALFISGAFLVIYVRRVAREARRLSEALNNSRLDLEYEQKISAFGALAAAVAHELGSPLSTIAIVSSELSHGLKDTPFSEDCALLQSQVSRCSTILSDFSKHNVLADRSFEHLSLREFVERVAEPYTRETIALEIIPQSTGEQPNWPLNPGLMHGVGNIIHNAYQFAKSKVTIRLSWNGPSVIMCIEDDGKGFPDDLLPRLGNAYVSGRTAGEHGMGLGLFIAKTLLERSGANIIFVNQASGGAQVTITWEFLPT